MYIVHDSHVNPGNTGRKFHISKVQTKPYISVIAVGRCKKKCMSKRCWCYYCCWLWLLFHGIVAAL